MTETQTPSTDRETESGMRRRVCIGVWLCMAVGVFVTTTGIIWDRSSWRKPLTSSSVLVVEGSKEFEGTTIVVEGSTLPNPRRAKITENKSFVCRFPLPRGKYDVHVQFTDGSHWDTAVQMDEHQYAWLPRTRLEECKKKALPFLRERRDGDLLEGSSTHGG
ncbi:MAG: hypothetical protein ACM359_10535 [Bacillota bacterium]